MLNFRKRLNEIEASKPRTLEKEVKELMEELYKVLESIPYFIFEDITRIIFTASRFDLTITVTSQNDYLILIDKKTFKDVDICRLLSVLNDMLVSEKETTVFKDPEVLELIIKD